MEKLYHIGIDDSHKAKYAILPGDPDRVEKIAKYLDNPKKIGQNREYTTYLGQLEGDNVLVMSTGMGGPSTAIGVEELHMTGVENFIRVGTCGGMNPKVKGGDLVIVTGSVKMDGTSNEYVPIEFPAVSDFSLTLSLVEAANEKEYTNHIGIVQCKDSFYGQHNPDRMPVAYELKNKWEAYKKANCLASEMESATLFTVSQVLGTRAACVLNTVWNQEADDNYQSTQVHDTSKAIEVAIEAVRREILKNK